MSAPDFDRARFLAMAEPPLYAGRLQRLAAA